MAVPTSFHGIKFRSKLEARYAAFFTNLGWTWEYEPRGADTPRTDFKVCAGSGTLWVDIKPISPTLPAFVKAFKHEVSFHGKALTEYVMFGTFPFAGDSPHWDQPRAGLLFTAWETEDGEDGSDPDDAYPDWGVWVSECYGGDGPRGGRREFNPDHYCHEAGIFSETGSYHARPCGHSSGGRPPGQTDFFRLLVAWNNAGKMVGAKDVAS